ncbi:hypothetical protein N2152v2_009994 [Parachlorella kessleri]
MEDTSRPVEDLPPPGLFISKEALQRFSVLAALMQSQADRPAPPAVLPTKTLGGLGDGAGRSQLQGGDVVAGLAAQGDAEKPAPLADAGGGSGGDSPDEVSDSSLPSDHSRRPLIRGAAVTKADAGTGHGDRQREQLVGGNEGVPDSQGWDDAWQEVTQGLEEGPAEKGEGEGPAGGNPARKHQPAAVIQCLAGGAAAGAAATAAAAEPGGVAAAGPRGQPAAPPAQARAARKRNGIAAAIDAGVVPAVLDVTGAGGGSRPTVASGTAGRRGRGRGKQVPPGAPVPAAAAAAAACRPAEVLPLQQGESPPAGTPRHRLARQAEAGTTGAAAVADTMGGLGAMGGGEAEGSAGVGEEQEGGCEAPGEEEEEEEEEGVAQVGAAAAAGAGAGAGTRKVSDAAVGAALKRLGKPSLQALLGEQTEKAAAAAAAGGGPQGRKKRKQGHLADLLNPKNPLHHPGFAAAYKAAREELDKKQVTKQRKGVLKQHSKLVHRWSALTADEHCWYLEHAGKPLAGAEAERLRLLEEQVREEQGDYYQSVQQLNPGQGYITLADLSWHAQIREEQGEYYQSVQQNAQAHTHRYTHCTPRQAAQIEADFACRRERVRSLPQVYRLSSVLPIPPSEGTAAHRPEHSTAQLAEHGAPALRHVATLGGSPPAWVEAVAAAGLEVGGGNLGTVPPAGGNGAAGGECIVAGPWQQQQQRREGRPYRKHATAELSHDATLTHLLTQRLRPALAAAAAAGKDDGDATDTDSSSAGACVCCLAASAFTALAATPMAGNGPGWELPITVAEAPAAIMREDTVAAVVDTCWQAQPQQAQQPAGGQEGQQAQQPAGEPEGQQQQPEQQAKDPQDQQPPHQQGQLVEVGIVPPRRVVYVDKPLVPRLLSLRRKQARLHKYAVLSAALRSAEHAAEQAAEHAEPGDQHAGQPVPPAASPRAGQHGVGQSMGCSVQSSSPAGLAPRHACYDLWTLGGLPLVVRSHDRALWPAGQAQQAQREGAPTGLEGASKQQQREQDHLHGGVADTVAGAPPTGQLVVPVVRAEYLPPPDAEELTVQASEELAAWWCKAALRPGCSLLVARASVSQSRLLSTELLDPSSPELVQLGPHATSAGLRFVHSVLGALGALPPGRYLLTHAPQDASCCLFKALPGEALGEEEGVQRTAGCSLSVWAPALPALPCSASIAQQGVLYDLHAAHARSGEEDPYEDPFIPPRWRPFDPAIPQIPHTFPPRLSLGRLGVTRPRKRQRAQLPFAWGVLGAGGDFDQVGHVGQISRQDYAQQLREELA